MPNQSGPVVYCPFSRQYISKYIFFPIEKKEKKLTWLEVDSRLTRDSRTLQLFVGKQEKRFWRKFGTFWELREYFTWMGEDKVQKSIVEELNRYEKQEELRKAVSFFTKWLEKNTRAVSVGSWGRINQQPKLVSLCLEFNKPNKQNVYCINLFKIIPGIGWWQEWNIKSSLKIS